MVAVRRAMTVLVLVILGVLLLSVTVSAEEEEAEYGDEYRAMLDALPDEVADILPEKLYSEDPSDIMSGAAEMADFGYLLGKTFELIGLELEKSLKLFATLMGILVIAAVINAVKSSFSSEGINNALSLCTSAAVFLTAVASQYSIISSVASFFTRICNFAGAMLPLMGVLYAMGGNVSSAVTSHSSLMIFMSVVETFCARTVVPVSGVCMAFAATSATAPDINIGGIAGSFKKLYTNTLTFIMTVFVTVMGAQSLLATKADSIVGKTAKFAVGNLIPVVGSALAGTLGTISTSVEYIRSSVGVIGIIVVALMLLPTLVTLLLTKLTLSLTSGVADVLGCGREGKMIGEMAGINAFLLASACICSATFIFMLAMFAKCVSATGG